MSSTVDTTGAGSGNSQCDEDIAPSLDWSVSAISAVSGGTERHFQPSELSSQASSAPSSPLKHGSGSGLLVTQGMDDLVASLQSLMDNSPLQMGMGLSFQKLDVEETEMEGEETEMRTPRQKHSFKDKDLTPHITTPTRNLSHNTTPPCKDPGMHLVVSSGGDQSPASARTTAPSSLSKQLHSISANSSKLDKVRAALRDLEQHASAKQVPKQSSSSVSSSNNSSKLPRRVLDFGSRTSSSFIASAQTTVIENKCSEDLRKELADVRAALTVEQEKVRQMEAAQKELRARSTALEQGVAAHSQASAQKDVVLGEMRARWTQLVEGWKQEQDRLMRAVLTGEQQEEVLTSEMEKAVSLAEDYRKRFELEAAARAGVEREAEEGMLRVKSLAEEVTRESEGLKREVVKAKEAEQEVKEKFGVAAEEFERIMNEERAKFEEREQGLQQKNTLLEAKLIAAESDMHNYYQSQLETILRGKIGSLQSHVEEMERSLTEEKQSALAALKAEQERQINFLKENFTSEVRNLMTRFSKQQTTTESSLSAARREADCLRVQLRNEEQKKTMKFAGGWSDSEQSRKFRSLGSTDFQSGGIFNCDPFASSPSPAASPPARCLSGPPSASTTTCNGSPLVPNNKRNNDSPTAEASSRLSKEEKEGIAQKYLQEFLDANPTVAMDRSFMSSLNTMATHVVQQSFNASTAAATVTHPDDATVTTSTHATSSMASSSSSRLLSLENNDLGRINQHARYKL